MKLYKDTENGETLTEAQLQAEFEILKAEEPETYDYNFTQFIDNCLSKNGFLMVIDIFNRYSGKKCGEKTKEKIRTEAKENGINMYFVDDGITFYMGLYGYDRITLYTRYIDGVKQTITDNDNKINTLEANMFHLPDAETIIDNVEVYTEEKEAEFLRLKEMYKALDEAIKDYNNNCPFKSQYIRDGIAYMD